MALGGKTIQYTLAVDMQTGQLTAESKRVATELNLIQKQAESAGTGFTGFARDIKHLKSELSLLFLGSFGGYALAMGVLSDAIGAAVQKAKEFMFGIKLDPKIVDDMRAYAKSLSDAALSQDEIVANKIREYALQVQLNKLQNENSNNQRAFFVELSKAFSGRGFDIDQLINAYEQWRITSKKLDDQTKVQTADEIIREQWKHATLALDKRYSAEINRLKQEGLDIDKQANISREDELRQFREIASIEKQRMMDAQEFQKFAPSAGQPIAIPFAPIADIAGGLPETPVGQLKSELDSLIENAGIYEAFFVGLSNGFASIGEALVESQNPLKSFGAVFLKLIAQLAVQFGTFLILYGTGMGFVPGGQAFSAGAIAAGVALTVFGGALGALANRIGGAGAGGRTSEREQRFRDSRFNTANSGGTVINNYINFQNTIGLTRDAMKEVGEAVSKEIFKQEKLGRIQMA